MTYELQPLRLQSGWTVQWNNFTEAGLRPSGVVLPGLELALY